MHLRVRQERTCKSPQTGRWTVEYIVNLYKCHSRRGSTDHSSLIQMTYWHHVSTSPSPYRHFSNISPVTKTDHRRTVNSRLQQTIKTCFTNSLQTHEFHNTTSWTRTCNTSLAAPPREWVHHWQNHVFCNFSNISMNFSSCSVTLKQVRVA